MVGVTLPTERSKVKDGKMLLQIVRFTTRKEQNVSRHSLCGPATFWLKVEVMKLSTSFFGSKLAHGPNLLQLFNYNCFLFT